MRALTFMASNIVDKEKNSLDKIMTESAILSKGYSIKKVAGFSSALRGEAERVRSATYDLFILVAHGARGRIVLSDNHILSSGYDFSSLQPIVKEGGKVILFCCYGATRSIDFDPISGYSVVPSMAEALSIDSQRVVHAASQSLFLPFSHIQPEGMQPFSESICQVQREKLAEYDLSKVSLPDLLREYAQSPGMLDRIGRTYKIEEVSEAILLSVLQQQFSSCSWQAFCGFVEKLMDRFKGSRESFWNDVYRSCVEAEEKAAVAKRYEALQGCVFPTLWQRVKSKWQAKSCASEALFANLIFDYKEKSLSKKEHLQVVTKVIDSLPLDAKADDTILAGAVNHYYQKYLIKEPQLVEIVARATRSQSIPLVTHALVAVHIAARETGKLPLSVETLKQILSLPNRGSKAWADIVDMIGACFDKLDIEESREKGNLLVQAVLKEGDQETALALAKSFALIPEEPENEKPKFKWDKPVLQSLFASLAFKEKSYKLRSLICYHADTWEAYEGCIGQAIKEKNKQAFCNLFSIYPQGSRFYLEKDLAMRVINYLMNEGVQSFPFDSQGFCWGVFCSLAPLRDDELPILEKHISDSPDMKSLVLAEKIKNRRGETSKELLEESLDFALKVRNPILLIQIFAKLEKICEETGQVGFAVSDVLKVLSKDWGQQEALIFSAAESYLETVANYNQAWFISYWDHAERSMPLPVVVQARRIASKLERTSSIQIIVDMEICSHRLAFLIHNASEEELIIDAKRFNHILRRELERKDYLSLFVYIAYLRSLTDKQLASLELTDPGLLAQIIAIWTQGVSLLESVDERHVREGLYAWMKNLQEKDRNAIFSHLSLEEQIKFIPALVRYEDKQMLSHYLVKIEPSRIPERVLEETVKQLSFSSKEEPSFTMLSYMEFLVEVADAQSQQVDRLPKWASLLVEKLIETKQKDLLALWLELLLQLDISYWSEKVFLLAVQADLTSLASEEQEFVMERLEKVNLFEKIGPEEAFIFCDDHELPCSGIYLVAKQLKKASWWKSHHHKFGSIIDQWGQKIDPYSMDVVAEEAHQLLAGLASAG